MLVFQANLVQMSCVRALSAEQPKLKFGLFPERAKLKTNQIQSKFNTNSSYFEPIYIVFIVVPFCMIDTLFVMFVF